MTRPNDFSAAMEPWGWSPWWVRAWAAVQAQGEPARVLAVDRGSLLLVGHEPGTRRTTTFRGRVSAQEPPTVGDWCVTSRPEGADHWRVHQTLPRRTFLARRAAGRATRAQALVANVDVVFLVCGLDRDQGLRSIERLLTIVLDGGAAPVVVLNKADVCDDLEDAVYSARRVAPGFAVVPVSATTGQGLDILSYYLEPGSTVALLGPSGVGKSTLVNAFAMQSTSRGAAVAQTRPVRDGDHRGRHTTTRRQLHPIAGRGLLIDTPGLRELGAWIGQAGLSKAFPEVEDVALTCRFRDCQHDQEPGCAVRAALLEGRLDAERFHSYLELGEEAKALDKRRCERGRMEGKREGKLLSKEIRRYFRDRRLR